jgi:type II secretory pathway component PulK
MHAGAVDKSNPRGSVLVIVLVSLLVASMLGAGLIRTVLVHHRQMRVLSGQQQAFWLAEAGVQRAVRQLSKTPEYNGETWKVPADVLGLSRTAEVTIEVATPGGEPDGREIRVQVVLDDRRAQPGGYHREYQFRLPNDNQQAVQ